jgi:tetratricopeptide (TPR) repeat protein
MTASPDTRIEHALALHQAGRIAEAESIYREVLATDPQHVVANQFLGVAAYQQGRLEEAVERIGVAARLAPNQPGILNNLGIAFDAMGRGEDAARCFGEVVRLSPQSPDAHAVYAEALSRLGHLDDAVRHAREAIRHRPARPEACFSIGSALHRAGQLDEAVAAYLEALRLRPDFAQVMSNLAAIWTSTGRWNDGIAILQRALSLRPDLAAAHINLGNALREAGRFEEAIASLRRGLELDPNMPEAFLDLGNAYRSVDRPEEAVRAYRAALHLEPEHVESLNNLGNSLKDCGEYAEARGAFDRALALAPDNGRVHFNRSMLRLLQGDFTGGWNEYEWRWTQPGFRFSPPPDASRYWDGSALAGSTLVLFAEQGFGDTIQFVRFADLAKARGGTIILVCQSELCSLLARVSGIDHIIARGEPWPTYDVHAPLLSLPRILGTADHIPAKIPYLCVDDVERARWTVRIPTGGFRIGIAWHGNPANATNRTRSVPLVRFAALAKLGVRLISLQKGSGREEIGPHGFELIDLTDELHDFADTAALVGSLDLIIAIESSMAHLAGALGKPVWVALPYVPDWRWLLDRDDSPWYPTMRLFRQRTPGDWTNVFNRIAAALESLIS